ncbi:hypothetical protein K6H11_000209 [Candida tropicalis]
MLQPRSEQQSPGTKEQDRNKDIMMKDDSNEEHQQVQDDDDIEVDEETFSNHSGESFVLKSLVDSINH